MKKSIITFFLLCFFTSIYTQTIIEGISFENYPRVDGSLSTFPLNKLVACKLLNIEYEWKNETSRYPATQYDYQMQIRAERLKSSIPFINGRIQALRTHKAFINLIENKANIILSVRKMSIEEKKYADSLGVKLIETPIALDALVFLVYKERGIKSLTAQQIQDIYMGKIDRWEILGGDSAILYPYIRSDDIQELMESLVMKGLKKRWDDFFITLGKENQYAICFSLYCKELMMRDQFYGVQTLAINNIEPNRETITNRIYPYVSELHAVIRSDLPKNDLAYKLYEWLQSKDGQETIKESGYIPIMMIQR